MIGIGYLHRRQWTGGTPTVITAGFVGMLAIWSGGAQTTVPISPPAGKIQTECRAPDIRTPQTIVPAADSLSLTGGVPVVAITLGPIVYPNKDTLEISGSIPNVGNTTSYGGVVSMGALWLGGAQWGYPVGEAPAPPVDTLVITGATPVIIPGKFAAPERACTLNLAWDANSESDLAGYKIYCGTATGTYDTYNGLDVGNVTSHLLTGLGPHIYFVSITAYDTLGLESDHSNEVSGLAKGLTLTGIAPEPALTYRVNVTPLNGVLTITGGVPTILDVPHGHLAFSGVAPAVNVGIVIYHHHLRFTGRIPMVMENGIYEVPVPADTLAITGRTPVVTIELEIIVAPNKDTLAITGVAPTVTLSLSTAVYPGSDALVVSGGTPEVRITHRKIISVPTGALAITTIRPDIQLSEIQVSAGVLVLDGGEPIVIVTAPDPVTYKWSNYWTKI